MDVHEAGETLEHVMEMMSSAIIADRRFLEKVLLAVVADGHVLLEDVPGTGKTLTGRSIATTLGLSFSRIQFTPDLLPSDVTGSHVYDEQKAQFRFREGPIFGNVVLADEINRAPPKTQSALLEAMAERQVTVQGETHSLPDPFFVIATQNPIEMEGTFELPEAQRDRFLIKASIGYPDTDGEVELLRRRLARQDSIPSLVDVISADQVRELQSLPETVVVDEDLLEYLVEITQATREDRRVAVGVSPRGTQRLLETCRAVAIMEGREFVKPSDIKFIAPSVLAHRVVLVPDVAIDNTDPATIIEEILENIPVPTIE